ncbi:MAG TPA: hypothetical protein VGF77_13830 [Allosphingosinicella sp.]|jgi:hypothetical protein
MTPRLLSYNLTPEQFEAIASVGLDWAHADMLLGSALAKLAGITSPGDASDLIYAIDLKKKIDLIHARHKRGEVPVPAADLVSELVHVGERYRPDRNMLAHGIVLYENDGSPSMFWSQSKMKGLDIGVLDAIVSEARYTVHVASHFMGRLLGLTPPRELPPRPPERAARQ